MLRSGEVWTSSDPLLRRALEKIESFNLESFSIFIQRHCVELDVPIRMRTVFVNLNELEAMLRGFQVCREFAICVAAFEPLQTPPCVGLFTLLNFFIHKYF